MLVDDIGDVTVTNDGATILKLLEVEHPAAKVGAAEGDGAALGGGPQGRRATGRSSGGRATGTGRRQGTPGGASAGGGRPGARAPSAAVRPRPGPAAGPPRAGTLGPLAAAEVAPPLIM
jgi:hypothetical protein